MHDDPAESPERRAASAHEKEQAGQLNFFNESVRPTPAELPEPEEILDAARRVKERP